MAGFPLFKTAIEDGDVETFRKYFDENSHAKFANQQYNVLQYAIYCMQPKIVEIILDSGIYDINYKNNNDETAIVIAMNEFNEIAEENAKNEKKIAIAKAKEAVELANAKARRVRADSIAYANRKIAASLTKEFVELERIKKWNGKQPQVVGSSTILKGL